MKVFGDKTLTDLQCTPSGPRRINNRNIHFAFRNGQSLVDADQATELQNPSTAESCFNLVGRVILKSMEDHGGVPIACGEKMGL